MHFDLAHAIVVGIAVSVVIFVMHETGIVKRDREKKFSWKMVLAITVVVFILNLIWPYGP
ncbi:hypothetical protein [Tateyamaria sp.]|uniref:hypothetical protein n=1 Tax=Tateyamaria sp. TaxID=1929288 RepID=UPI00329D76B7